MCGLRTFHDHRAPKENQPKENQPKENQPKENQPKENQPKENQNDTRLSIPSKSDKT
jgi:hypothetical protein